jgi:hypothetical protein
VACWVRESCMHATQNADALMQMDHWQAGARRRRVGADTPDTFARSLPLTNGPTWHENDLHYHGLQSEKKPVRVMRRALLLLSYICAASRGVPVGGGVSAPPPAGAAAAEDWTASADGGGRGAIIYLADGAPSRVRALRLSLASLDAAYNSAARRPVIVFFDTGGGESAPPLSAAQCSALARASAGPLSCAAVDLAALVPAAALAAAPAVVAHGDGNVWGLGYRLMANFFAGPVALHPALRDYAYYWRLDTDAQLLGAVARDPFAELEAAHAAYGYVAEQCDWHLLTTGLAAAAAAALGVDDRGLAARLPPAFVDGSCGRGPGEPDGGTYNNRIFYNNFEVVSLAWLRSPAYQRFYERVAAAGGILAATRWGDAPIRTLAALALLPRSALHRFRISYAHQGLFGPIVIELVAGAVAAVAAAAAVALALACAARRAQARARKRDTEAQLIEELAV